MTAVVSMLRGINLAGHNRIRMDELRTLYESIGLRQPQTYVQSGNVVFRSSHHDLTSFAGALRRAIEHKLGFHAQVLLGATAELRDVVARSPFAGRNATNAANSSSLSCLPYPMPKPRVCCTALILILRRYTFLAASCSWHGTFEIDARTGKDPQKVRNRQKFQHCDEAAGNGRKAGDRAKVTGGNG